MGRAECVIYINIAQGSKLFSELRIVLFFFGMETEIFEQKHVAIFHCRNLSNHIVADAIISKCNI